MSIYTEMKEWREKREEMERVCNETRENCCKRYAKKDAYGNTLVVGGCENCPLMYTTKESANVTPRNLTGEVVRYRCMASRPLNEFYEFITKEADK